VALQGAHSDIKRVVRESGSNKLISKLKAEVVAKKKKLNKASKAGFAVGFSSAMGSGNSTGESPSAPRTVIAVSDAAQLQAAAASIASDPHLPYSLKIASGEYNFPPSQASIEIRGEDVLVEGAGMKRQSSSKFGEDAAKHSQLNVKVVVTTKHKFEMKGFTCTKGLDVSAPACKAVFKTVHVDGDRNRMDEDAFCIKAAWARLDDCEVFGGSDGLFLDCDDCYIKDSDIRWAQSRGIFADSHFTVEGVEVSNCGDYGMKTRGGCTRVGQDNDIQPGPWDEVATGMGGFSGMGGGVFGGGW
jgi:hypothetical protein